MSNLLERWVDVFDELAWHGWAAGRRSRMALSDQRVKFMLLHRSIKIEGMAQVTSKRHHKHDLRKQPVSLMTSMYISASLQFSRSHKSSSNLMSPSNEDTKDSSVAIKFYKLLAPLGIVCVLLEYFQFFVSFTVQTTN